MLGWNIHKAPFGASDRAWLCLSAGCCSCKSHNSHPAFRKQVPKTFLFFLISCCHLAAVSGSVAEWGKSVRLSYKSCCGGEFSLPGPKGKLSQVPHPAGRAVAVEGEGTLTSSFYPGPSSLPCHPTNILLVCLLF